MDSSGELGLIGGGLIVALLFSSCGMTLDPTYIKQADQMCKDNGGVKAYWATYLGNSEVRCNDNSLIEFNIK